MMIIMMVMMMTMTMMMMTMMLTKYDDGCGDADGDDDGADHQHAHDNDGDNGDDDDADGDVDNDDNLMMMIISNLNDDIFRTAKEDAEVAMSAVVMSPLFFAPELREHIALFLPSLCGLAFVNRDWNNSVLQTISNLREEFNNGVFQVDWLIDEWGGVQASLIRMGLKKEVRMHRLIGADWRGLPDLHPTVRWWYILQLHLHGFWSQYVHRFGHSLTLEEFFKICYRQSWFNSRQCRELFPDMFRSHSIITVSQFHHLRFVRTRDLVCPELGYRVKEVFGTLLCMVRDDAEGYCRPLGECGCDRHCHPYSLLHPYHIRYWHPYHIRDNGIPSDSDSDQDSDYSDQESRLLMQVIASLPDQLQMLPKLMLLPKHVRQALGIDDPEI